MSEYSKLSEAQKEKSRAGVRRWRKRHPDRLKRMNREQDLKKNGWTLKEYNKIFIRQRGVCAICGEEQIRKNQYGDCPLDADHDHITMKKRGLLCCRCNIGLGQFRVDSKESELLIKAIEYIAKHS